MRLLSPRPVNLQHASPSRVAPVAAHTPERTRLEHGGELITTIALGLSAAFLAGLLARRLGLPSIVGYLLAGVALGPFTPGLFADQAVATELAEIGVILLMFGVGIHFSFRDLLAVRGIAIPGAVVQSAVAATLGVGLAIVLGWGIAAGVVLGLSLSVASTVVLLRALIEHNALDTVHGRAAVGWLIVEDIFTVLVLVLLSSFALVASGDSAGGNVVFALGEALLKAAALGVLMVVVGARVVQWLLLQVAREGSQEMVHAGRAGSRTGHRLRVERRLRCLTCPRRIPRGCGGRRDGPLAQGRRRCPAAA